MLNRLHEALEAEQTARIITITTEDQIARIADFAPYAEAAELRGDLLPSQDPGYLAEQAAKVAEHLGVLFTLRSASEMGEWRGSYDQKLAIIDAVLPLVDGVDTETFSPRTTDLVAHIRASGLIAISSYHEFDNMSADMDGLDGVVEVALDAQKADFSKLAIMTNTPAIAGALIDYSSHARRNTIVMGMGICGKLTREDAIRRGHPAVYISPVLPGEGQLVVRGQLNYLEAEALILTNGRL